MFGMFGIPPRSSLLGGLRSHVAARPWLPWFAPLVLTAVTLTLRVCLSVLAWTLPVEPTLPGLLTLTFASALYTAPLFHWPARIPLPVLMICLLHAVFFTQYVAVFNVSALGLAPAMALAAVNLPLMAWIAGNAAVDRCVGADDWGVRAEVYRLYSVWLPLCLVPQVTLIVLVTVLSDSSVLLTGGVDP